MRITNELTDEAALAEVGRRISQVRIRRNQTQAALADQAGVGKRTIERMEAGQAATRLPSFLRVCRALGLLARFEAAFPGTEVSPIAQLEVQRKTRRRARRQRAEASKPRPWTWSNTR